MTVKTVSLTMNDNVTSQISNAIATKGAGYTSLAGGGSVGGWSYLTDNVTMISLSLTALSVIAGIIFLWIGRIADSRHKQMIIRIEQERSIAEQRYNEEMLEIAREKLKRL